MIFLASSNKKQYDNKEKKTWCFVVRLIVVKEDFMINQFKIRICLQNVLMKSVSWQSFPTKLKFWTEGQRKIRALPKNNLNFSECF